MNFIPINKMQDRIKLSKEENDFNYFFELLLYGEYLTKIITLGIVATINDDNDRTRYRFEYNLARANAIGDYSRAIDEILTGTASQQLSVTIRDHEQKELTQRCNKDEWQHIAVDEIVKCLDIFNIEHDKLPAKVPLRNWFHYFTILRNKTKGHGATRITPCSEAIPHIEKSIELIINNFSIFNRPWVYMRRNLSSRYRIAHLNEKTKDFDKLKRKNEETYEDGIYFQLDYKRKVNLFFTDPELTDFFVTNGNFSSKSEFETISYITDKKAKQDGSNYLITPSKLPKSDTEGLSELDVINNVFTNMPSPIDVYVNRKEPEDELFTTLLEEERFPIITLVGRGGIGKTSLALNVIYNISDKNRFDLIIWFSARDIDLMLEGPKQVQTKVLNQNDIAKEYFSLISPKEKIKNIESEFEKILTKNPQGKTLFIFDNFETVTNPIELFNWLNTYIRNPNKILITSRLSRNFKADYPIEISGMEEDECKELINIYSSKFNIGELLTPKYINQLVSESSGHPYIIKILLGEVAKTKKALKIERIVAKQDEILVALFKRTFNTFSPSAKRTFLTLCSWSSMIPLIALEAVLLRPENEKIDIEEAIEELNKSSFIELIGNEPYVFVSVPLAASIYGKTELEVFPEKPLILEDRKLLIEFGATHKSSIKSGIADKIDRKFKAVAKRINNSEQLEKEISTLEFIAGKYAKGWLYIAEIYDEHSNYEKEKYALREYLKTPSLLPKEKEKVWSQLSNLCQITKDWDGESHALFELSALPNVDFTIISEVANRINSYLYQNNFQIEIENKHILVDKLISVMEARIDKEGGATDYSRIAWLALNINKIDIATNMVKKGLLIDKNNSHCLKIEQRLKATNNA